MTTSDASCHTDKLKTQVRVSESHKNDQSSATTFPAYGVLVISPSRTTKGKDNWKDLASSATLDRSERSSERIVKVPTPTAPAPAAFRCNCSVPTLDLASWRTSIPALPATPPLAVAHLPSFSPSTHFIPPVHPPLQPADTKTRPSLRLQTPIVDDSSVERTRNLSR